LLGGVGYATLDIRGAHDRDIGRSGADDRPTGDTGRAGAEILETSRRNRWRGCTFKASIGDEVGARIYRGKHKPDRKKS